jgi:hypothetical protein
MIDFEKIASLPEFQNAPREKQTLVRDLYFKNYMADKTPPGDQPRAYRDFVFAGEPVLSSAPPDAEKSLLRRGLEWGAGALGVPMEPSRAMKSEEGARALIELQAKEAGMKPGEYKVGPQALNQAAGAFTDAGMLGIPGAIRKEMVGGEGLVPRATTPGEKIASGVGELGGFIAGAPGAFMKPIAGLAAPIVKKAIPEATSLLERAASGVATQAPALAAGFAARNVGEALQQPTLGKAAQSMGRAAGEGFATGGIFGTAGAIQNRIARIAIGLASMEAERATGLKAPIFDNRPIEEKAFDIAQTLFFLWGKGGDKVLDQAERSIGQKQLSAPAGPPLAAGPDLSIHLHETPNITVRDVPPGPPPALVGRRQAVLPPAPTRLALPPPGGEYRGPFLGEGFEMMPSEGRAPVIEQKRRPAAESANAFQKALNTVQSPQGLALLKSRLAEEQAAGIPSEAPPAAPLPPPTMAQIAEQRLGNAPVLPPLQQALAPKPVPVVTPKEKPKAFEMDPDNEAHFETWLDRTVPDEQRGAVESSMRKVLADHPELVEEGRSWPEIRRMAEGGGVSPEPKPAVKEAAPVEEPWQMTRDEFNFAENKPKVDAIQQAIRQGKRIVNATQYKATQLTKPEHISIDKNGDVRIAAGNKRLALTDDYVDAMANQAGFELPIRSDKIYHHAEVEKALSEGKPVPPEVLKDYLDLQPKNTDRIKSAYDALRAKSVSENIEIAAIRDKAGVSQSEMEAYLKRQGAAGNSVTTGGEWSLTDEHTRSGAVHISRKDVPDLLARIDEPETAATKPEAPASLVPASQKPISAKTVVPFKTKVEPKATTLRGAIKAMGGVNPLNFKGEFKEAPVAAKFMMKRSGTPIDLAEQRLKDEGWLKPDESLAMVLRDKDNLRRGKVLGEGPEKREQDLTAQEKEVKAGVEWEPEEPPKGDYIPMKAEDLPVGKKLTLIAGKSARGWDTFEVKNKDEFGVTLEDGEKVDLAPGEKVEVRKEDLPEKTPAVEDRRPALVLQREQQMPKVQAEMRTRGKKMGKAQQGGIEFGSPPTPEKIEFKPEPVSAKEKAGAEIVKKRIEEGSKEPLYSVVKKSPGQTEYRISDAGWEVLKNTPYAAKLRQATTRDTLGAKGQKRDLFFIGRGNDLRAIPDNSGFGTKDILDALSENKSEGWKTKSDKEGKQIETLPGKGSVSGDESIGFYAFDAKGRIIGEGDIVDGFKTQEQAKAAVEENAKPKVDAKEDIGSMADRMKDADPEKRAAIGVKRVLMNESGAIDIDFDALKRGIKSLRAKLPKKDIGLVTQGFGLPTWVADRYPNSAGKVQEVIDNRFRNKNMIRNEYYRELLDSWDGLSKEDIEKVGKVLWRGDQLGKALGAAGLAKLTPPQRKAYEKTREILDYIWYEDRPELMRSMGLSNNEISEYYKQAGSRGGYMPHERKGRYFGRVIDTSLQPGDQVVYRKHFDDFLLTLTGKNAGVKQSLVKSNLESDFPGKLIEIGENQKAMAEGAYNDVSPEATQELIDASMKYMNATPGQKDALRTAMRQAVADVFKVRGFGEHFMKRKDVPGFDTSNWQDAILNYVSSWAGYKSKLAASRELWGVWGSVDWKGLPELRKYVSKQVKDTFANETYADRAIDTARGVLFRQYLSGVLKSAFLNLTQPFIATMPRLTTETHWAGVKLTAEMAKAAKDIVASVGTKAQGDMTQRQTAQSGRLTKEELMGIRKARENGIIGNQMTEELLGRAAGKFGSNLRKIDNFLGWAFANAEMFNREVSYLTAFRIGKNEKGMSFEDASKFAEDIVDQTQFRYGKTNLPPFARGESWAAKGTRAAYAFRHYPNNLFHLWGKLAGSGPMGAAGIAKSLFALGAFGGVASLPFIQSIALVYNKITGSDLLSDISEKAGQFAKYALYGVPGGALSVDMSGSLGTDIPTSLADVGGVMTDWAKRSQQTYEDIEAKDYQRAAEDFPLTPQALRGPLAGIRMASRGMEKRSGKDVKDDDFETVKLTPGEVARKFAGFQPLKLSETYRKEQSAKMITSYWTDKADTIRRQIRLADDKGTGSKEWEAAMAAVDKYNESIPDYIPAINIKKTLSERIPKKTVLLKQSIK